MEHGPEHSRLGPRPLPRPEDHHDALDNQVCPDEAVRLGEQHPGQIPRPQTERASELLHGLRGGGKLHKYELISNTFILAVQISWKPVQAFGDI